MSFVLFGGLTYLLPSFFPRVFNLGTTGWPHTWEFFRNTLLSGGLFTGLFVAAMKFEEKAEAKKEEAAEPEGEEQPEEAKS